MLALGLTAFLAPVSAAQAPPIPAVRVLGDGLEPRTSFDPGERFAVEGTGFPPNATVVVTLESGDGSHELGTQTSRDDGSFLARLRLPARTVVGAATVRASGGGVSATAAVAVGAQATPDEGAAALWPWAVALAAVAAYTFVVWRRTGARRQATGERGPKRADTDEAPGPAPAAPRERKKKERSDRVRKLSDDVSAWTKRPD